MIIEKAESPVTQLSVALLRCLAQFHSMSKAFQIADETTLPSGIVA